MGQVQETHFNFKHTLGHKFLVIRIKHNEGGD